MKIETLQKIANVTGLEPFAVMQGIQSRMCADDSMEKVYCVFGSELTLMASFYLSSHAAKFAAQLAQNDPLRMVVLVGSFDTEVKHVQAA